MSRILLLTVLLAGLTAAAFSQPSGSPPATKAETEKQPADKKPAEKAPAATARSLVELLVSQVDFPAQEDARMTLADVLEQLGRKHGVNFNINEKAFKREGLADVLKTEVANPALPAMRITFGKLLARILSRVSIPSGATFLVREDEIEITTEEVLAAEINVRRPRQRPVKAVPAGSGAPADAKGAPVKDNEGSDPIKNSIDLPVVSVSVERQPLEAALRQIRLQTNFNLVFDPSLGEKVRAPVTLTLLNAPFDSAMRVLTEMTELDYVWLDNIIYITSQDKAKQLRVSWPDRRSSGRLPVITALPAAAGM